MSREAAGALVTGAVGLVVVAALAVGLAGVRETTEVSDIRAPDPAAGAAVSGLRTDSGLSLLGIRLRPAKYYALVQFTVGPDCLRVLDDGASWPLEQEACRSDVEIDGVVAGSGRTASGETIVAVERKIARECYEALLRLDAPPWPVPNEACAG